MGCVNCIYCATGLRDVNDNLCVACTKMPSNNPNGCGYMEIKNIEYIKEVMWFCPFKSVIAYNNLNNEKLYDQEWLEAENSGKKHYFWVEMYNGGKTIKLYSQATADLFTKRTGLRTELM